MAERLLPEGSFVFVYDYGQGDLWVVVRAKSVEDVLAKYPFLEWLDPLPSWIGEKFLSSVHAFDLSGEPPEWLKLASERRNSLN